MPTTEEPAIVSYEPKRRLSFWRLLLALIILSAIITGATFALRQWRAIQPAVASEPWFAAYTDVTATPLFAFEQMGASQTKEVVLSFVVSLPTDPCTPSWGGAYTVDQATATLDLDRRIARLRQQGGNVAVSFGGLINDELAVKCTDEGKLLQAYKTIVERYSVDTIDLDLELGGLTNTDAATRRASVLSKLQSDIRSQGKNLAIWVTLPVAPQGLTNDGTAAVTSLLKGGVDLAGVNAMTMNYGGSLEEGHTMLDGSKDALTETHRQLGILYQQAGTYLNSATLWSKIGATPMIGQNDSQDEIFSLNDAKGLNEFALSNKIGRMSMWSANRDISCGGNYVDLKVVSSSCSGVTQDKLAFATLLSSSFSGKISSSAKTVTTEDAKSELTPDDPTTSPYQIWSETGAYLQGTKVVWHHNVYEAKWWTQGNVPDNPVLQTWETPWKLIGPVLPGEKPIPQATLPAGTYPDWIGTAEYNTGDRVLFNGIPYQAKWWNKGDSPAASSSNATGSPWAPLTQAQINQIQEEKAKEPPVTTKKKTQPVSQ